MGVPGSFRLTYCRCVYRSLVRSPNRECEKPWGRKVIGGVSQREFSCEKWSVGAVRHWAESVVRDETQAEHIELIFGELRANAVKHRDKGRSDVRIYAAILVSGPKVAVSIGHTGGVGKGIPQLTDADTESESGRGLYLVCELAEQVVVHRGRDGWRIVAFLRSREEDAGPPP
uniref:ATP-binding protein n=1 Tax=Streptomyces sp. HSW2009 TaxID=3142890 RepID=UPI0032EDEF7F